MIRKIIRIDKEKCNGCGACADACHEGAISFEEREAPAYDEEAVKEAQKKVFAKNQAMSTHTGCPKLD